MGGIIFFTTGQRSDLLILSHAIIVDTDSVVFRDDTESIAFTLI
jgi:hypothetical protein